MKNIKSSAELSSKYKIPVDAADMYWCEICKYKSKTLPIKPRIVLISGCIILIIILSFAYITANFSALQGKSISPVGVGAEYNQSITVHTVPPTASSQFANPKNSNKVYVTPSGNKYHKSTCRHIQKSTLIEFSIEDAINAGYEPCKDCMQ